MLSEQDVDRIRKLKDDLDQEEANLSAAIRETVTTKDRIKQVRAEIRPAARTRFTAWLTNSDPEELRRYRAAIAEHKDQLQLVKHLRPRVAAKDARIDAAVAECLARSDQTYQRITTQQHAADRDLASCDQVRARAAQLRSRVDAALTQSRQLHGRKPKEVRKAMAPAVAQIGDEANALNGELRALSSRLRTYGSFRTKPVQPVDRGTELSSTRAALGAIHESLTSASRHITTYRRDLAKKRTAIVRAARSQALGS